MRKLEAVVCYVGGYALAIYLGMKLVEWVSK
jgi:hypothetical protein